MTVADLENRLSSSELTEWMAYEKMTGPLGRKRADIQAATVASAIANANRGKGGRKFTIEDFIPQYDGGHKTPQQMLAIVRGLNRAMGGEEHV